MKIKRINRFKSKDASPKSKNSTLNTASKEDLVIDRMLNFTYEDDYQIQESQKENEECLVSEWKK